MIITEEMIRTDSIDTSAIGSFEVYIDLNNGYEISVIVYVTAEINEEDIIGTFCYNGENFLGIRDIVMYKNGYAKLSTFADDAIVEYVEYDEYYAFDIDGAYVVLVLNEDGTAKNYVPDQERIITLYGDYETIEVFGNYGEAGYYVALYHMSLPMEDGSLIDGALSVIVYLDLDNRVATLATQEMHFDEEGYIFSYSPLPEDNLNN
ncbi:MAG: hypothetical protein IJY69_03960 [Clostridia bacterium]|nr:hypothetical protein [Clostridia bacterium]